MTTTHTTAMTEQELDQHIRDMGRLSEKAMRDGDQAGARIWSDRMTAAIHSRSPEHQARLAAEVEERITNGLDFFQSPAAVAMGKGQHA